MPVLGAILAGGASRRFGSDKAQALIGDLTLLEHACAALAPQVDDLVLCGRKSQVMRWLPDRPSFGLGPLGGLSAALADGAGRGFNAVVSVPVDVFPLPVDLVHCVEGNGACVLRSQFLVGYWPVHLYSLLEEHLASGERSMRSWIERTKADTIDDSMWRLRNVNRPADLA